MTSRRVVITGLGPVTPIGIGKDEFWNSLKEGRTNFSEITRFPLRDTDKCRIAAQIKVYTPFPENLRELANARQATNLAIADSGLNENWNKERTGVIIGDTNSNFALANAPASIRTLPYLLSNSLSGVIASDHGIKGFSTGISGACATGNHAVRTGFKEIRDGDADIMIVGGSSNPIQRPHMYDDFSDPVLKEGVMSISNDLKYGMKPFSEKRDGFILGEGAGVLVIEELSHAKQRGAHIYAEILGYGDATDIGSNFAKTSQKGYETAMIKAAKMAEERGINFERSNVHISAHGTATKLNDLTESRAINNAFDLTYIVTSSLKGFTGHTQGAASGIELIASALTLDTGYIPGMPWLESKDQIRENVNYIIEPSNTRPHLVLKNAAGFFGVYSTIALGRAD